MLNRSQHTETFAYNGIYCMREIGLLIRVYGYRSDKHNACIRRGTNATSANDNLCHQKTFNGGPSESHDRLCQRS